MDTPTATESLTLLGEEIRSLARDVSGPLRRVRVRSGTVMVEVEWDRADPPAAPSRPVGTAVLTQSEPGPDGVTAPSEPAMPTIDSPMVGTFYHAPGPGEQVFVEVGQTIVIGQKIGIVEAMKLLNPIEADIAGVVAAVIVGNGEAVQYGEALIRVGPAVDEPVDGPADDTADGTG